MGDFPPKTSNYGGLTLDSLGLVIDSGDNKSSKAMRSKKVMDTFEGTGGFLRCVYFPLS